MGLDASIRCRCWEDGKTPAPPCAPSLDEDGWLEPAEGADDIERSSAFYRWVNEACPHEDMEAVTQHISNWGGYRLFQEALEGLGWDHFPTLQRVFPEVNGGMAGPEDSRHCLAELTRFEELYRGDSVVLMDADTGDELQSYVGSYGGVFVLNGRTGVDIGFDKDGLFLAERDAKRVLFRAKRVAQRLLEPEATRDGRDGKVELANLDTGETFACTTAIPGKTVPWPDGRRQDDQGRVCTSYPNHLSVEVRSRDAGYFAYILAPLRTVFAAAVDIGNPVRWC